MPSVKREAIRIMARPCPRGRRREIAISSHLGRRANVCLTTSWNPTDMGVTGNRRPQTHRSSVNTGVLDLEQHGVNIRLPTRSASVR